MRTLLQPFVLVVTAVLGIGYAYLAWRLTSSIGPRLALSIPFLLVWIVPVVYWVEDRDSAGRIVELLHWSSYLSMAWLSFLVVLSIARDALLLLTAWLPLAAYHSMLVEAGMHSSLSARSLRWRSGRLSRRSVRMSGKSRSRSKASRATYMVSVSRR